MEYLNTVDHNIFLVRYSWDASCWPQRQRNKKERFFLKIPFLLRNNNSLAPEGEEQFVLMLSTKESIDLGVSRLL